MSSFVYFYSKFTDEFLLLTAGAMFFLLASYCYHWVAVRRRLGTSPQMVPASVVKEYLNQLIHEAQFIRTQLFGILSSANATNDPTHVDALFNSLIANRGSAANYAGAADANHEAETNHNNGAVPPELMDRIKSLEAQLAEKEGMIVNVNIEKTKLAKDLETFKQKSTTASAGSDQNNDELLKRLKMLEQQLEEYNMFEDDLANIKRIQQENEQLKRKIEEVSAGNSAATAKAPAPVLAVAPQPTVAEPTVSIEASAKAPSLDQASIDALLDGESPVPPAAEAAPPAVETITPPIATAPTTTDIPAAELENLAKSVETSLEAAKEEPIAKEPTKPTLTAVKNDAVPEQLAAEAVKTDTSSKSDEELLKEFENLLNSG